MENHYPGKEVGQAFQPDLQCLSFVPGSWRHQRGRLLGLVGWHDIGDHPRFPGTREWVAPSAPPTDWLQLVNQPQTEAEVAALRCCLNRGRAFGHPNWVTDTTKRLGLESTIRPRGRPKKQS